MTSHPQQFPPPSYGPPGGPGSPAPRPRTATTVWWVIIAVAALTLVGVIIWAIVGGSGTGPATPPTATTPAAAPTSTAPGPGTEQPAGPSTEPATGGADWGAWPPANVESLKDLSGAVMPPALSGFELSSALALETNITGQYDDLVSFRTFSAEVYLSADIYALWTSDLDDPVYVGDALCSWGASDFGTDATCIMAGQDQVLRLSTLGEDIGLEELAALAQELYGAL